MSRLTRADIGQEPLGLAVKGQAELLACRRGFEQVVAVDAAVMIIGNAVREQKGLEHQLQTPTDVRQNVFVAVGLGGGPVGAGDERLAPAEEERRQIAISHQRRVPEPPT